MKFWLVVLVMMAIACRAVAQQRPIEGIVFDKDSKERIAKVNVVNKRTGQSVYVSLKAEFKINAQTGDQLIVSKAGYYSDTVRLSAASTVLVYLKPTSIALKQVNVTDTLLAPYKRLLATRSEYSKAYGSNAYRDVLSLTPGIGAGISIDAIYNAFSRSGKNAKRLQEIIERDYRENVIDFRFSKTLVGSITGFAEPRLSDFMYKYRPSYHMVTTASQYEFIRNIKNNARRYAKNPGAYEPVPLQ